MTSRTALMFALAIMLIVANVMDSEGQVSQIAAKDAGELRDNVEQMSDMDGFTADEKIGPQLADEERDEERQQAERMADAGQPVIGEFSWDDEETSEADEPKQRETRTSSRLAKAVAPDHHRLAPGEVRHDFDPTIRKH